MYSVLYNNPNMKKINKTGQLIRELAYDHYFIANQSCTAVL